MNIKQIIEEFDSRVDSLLKDPPNKWDLGSLATVTRTLEAMERTRLARVRTLFAAIALVLAVIFLFF